MTLSTRLRRARHDEAGFSLIELTISMAIMLILFVVITLTSKVVFSQATVDSRSLDSATSAQTAVNVIDQFIHDVVNPYAAGKADFSGAPAGCWVNNAPSFYPAGVPISSTGGGALNGAIATPQDDAILVAHDYDFVFCGWAPNATVVSGSTFNAPHLYRIWVDPSTCSTAVHGTGYSCTLKIDDYGSSAPSCGSSFPAGSTSAPPCSGVVKTVYSMPGMWCPTACYADVSTGSGTPDTTPLFTYYEVNAAQSAATTPMDDKSAANASLLPSIHDVSLSLSTLVTVSNGQPTSGGTQVSRATDQVYLPDTIPQG